MKVINFFLRMSHLQQLHLLHPRCSHFVLAARNVVASEDSPPSSF